MNDLITFMSTKPGTNLLRNVARIADALEKIATVAEALQKKMDEDLARWEAEAKAKTVREK